MPAWSSRFSGGGRSPPFCGQFPFHPSPLSDFPFSPFLPPHPLSYYPLPSLPGNSYQVHQGGLGIYAVSSFTIFWAKEMCMLAAVLVLFVGTTISIWIERDFRFIHLDLGLKQWGIASPACGSCILGGGRSPPFCGQFPFPFLLSQASLSSLFLPHISSLFLQDELGAFCSRSP